MIEKTPPKKVNGKVTSLLKAVGRDFVSLPVNQLALTFEGIPGDFHHGVSRRSGGREPWYPRGTLMRNERQISILSVEELDEIAAAMEIDKLEPGWIGANIVVSGIANLSYLPPRTLLFFEGGVTLRVDGYNAPCRLSGGSIAKNVGVDTEGKSFKDSDMALAFKDAAHMKRGIVAWVEKEGTIKDGESFSARIWEQWIY